MGIQSAIWKILVSLHIQSTYVFTQIILLKKNFTLFFSQVSFESPSVCYIILLKLCLDILLIWNVNSMQLAEGK